MGHKARNGNGLSILKTTVRCQKASGCVSLTAERRGKFVHYLTDSSRPPPIHYQIPHLIREFYTSLVSEGHRLFHLFSGNPLSGVSLHNKPEIQVDPTEIPELKRETSTRRQTSQIKTVHSFPSSRIPALCLSQ